MPSDPEYSEYQDEGFEEESGSEQEEKPEMQPAPVPKAEENDEYSFSNFEEEES
jgi:hypothetical protein